MLLSLSRTYAYLKQVGMVQFFSVDGCKIDCFEDGFTIERKALATSIFGTLNTTTQYPSDRAPGQ